MSLAIFVFICVFSVIITFIIYLGYLKKDPGSPKDNMYYYEGELSFDSVLAQVGRIEKARGINLSGLKAHIEGYRSNANDTGRDIDYYYEDYISPAIKYLLLNNKNTFRGGWKLLDPFMRNQFIWWNILGVVIPIISSYYFTVTSDNPTNEIPFIYFILISVVMVFICLAVINLFIRAGVVGILNWQEQKFRKRNINLGHISKTIISMEAILAFMGGSDAVGADLIHTASLDGSEGYTSVSVGGGFSGGGGGGGGFGGFGGGSSGGGGASGGW